MTDKHKFSKEISLAEESEVLARIETMTAANTTDQQKKRGFQPGQSGNPAGRRQGSRNKATLAMEALMEGEGEALTRKVVELAKEGDTVAMRICMDRLYPVKKGRSVNIDLPVIGQAKDVVAGYSSVLKAVSEGEITPDEASTIANVLEAKRKALETSELEERIATIERKQSK